MAMALRKVSRDKAKANQIMDGHLSWLMDRFAKGTFLVAGTIEPKAGGAMLAHNPTLEQIQAIIKGDPFVSDGVVSAEII